MEVAAREISPESRIIHSDFIFYYYSFISKMESQIWKYFKKKKSLILINIFQKPNFSSEYLKEHA